MEVTEVRIKLMDEPGDRLKAFCSVTFDDCFVIRDLKIIEGSSGPFVAMRPFQSAAVGGTGISGVIHVPVQELTKGLVGGLGAA